MSLALITPVDARFGNFDELDAHRAGNLPSDAARQRQKLSKIEVELVHPDT